MRSILTVLFAFCTLTLINAQSIQSTFLSDSEIEWLNKEISDLDATYAKMKSAMSSGDNNLIAANKTAIMKSVNRLATNCKSTHDKIDYSFSIKSRQRRDTPDTPNYHYNKQKQNPKFEEIRINDKQLSRLKENSDKIIELRNAIKNTKYSFEGKTEKAEQNIIFVAEILSHAKKINTIINASLAEK